MAVLNPPDLRVRAVTSDDLSAMATIMYQAMPLDPQWDYRFPLRKEFPEDNYGCTRRMLQSMLEEDGVYIAVVTFPSPCLKEDEEVPAALAVWEMDHQPGKDVPEPPTEEKDHRRDANPERMRAFTTAITSAKKSYFDDKYQSGYVHLRILATHPDFQGRGAGAALCLWGMEQAKERGVPVTVFASPMGQKLYAHMGFEYLGAVPVQVEEEEEGLSIGVMICHPESQAFMDRASPTETSS